MKRILPILNFYNNKVIHLYRFKKVPTCSGTQFVKVYRIYSKYV